MRDHRLWLMVNSEAVCSPTIRHRYCNGRWWPTTPEIGLFNPDKMRTTRYRYRGTAIPTPWPATG